MSTGIKYELEVCQYAINQIPSKEEELLKDEMLNDLGIGLFKSVLSFSPDA
jgi:hypothetical protein